MSALLVDDVIIAELKRIRAYAESKPFSYEDMLEFQDMSWDELEDVGEPYRVDVPVGYRCAFTIEDQGPNVGFCRHMSLQSPNPGRYPRPEAINMIIPHLGFEWPAERCQTFMQMPEGEGGMIHVIEPMNEQVREALCGATH